MQTKLEELITTTLTNNRKEGRYTDWTGDGYAVTELHKHIFADILDSKYKFHQVNDDSVILFNGIYFVSVDVGGFLMVADNPEFYYRIELGFTDELGQDVFEYLQFVFNGKELYKKISDSIR